MSSAATASGLFEGRPREAVLHALEQRSRTRLEQLTDQQLLDLLENAVYHERKRIEKERDGEPETTALVDTLARALARESRGAQIQAGLGLVRHWAEEIHTHFDPRVYRFATSVLPRALTGLLSAKPRRLRDWDLSPSRNVRVEGPIDWLKELSQEATLILAPTHVSNLDSPVIGLALYEVGLPPFVYGAGLNLFENKVMGFFMSRLGAYTVDRKKRASLYKEVLKDYSVQALSTRHHSLFFPGGTRSRSGKIETHLKKGLLGTGIVAWQEMLEAGRRDSDVYVVPCTLSFQLVLEASSLIDDSLADAGKQRYIIDDDEFSRPGEVASFGRRVMELDDTVVCRFGAPMDVLGQPVPLDKQARREASERRRRYVCNRDGEVERDEQRDRIYTDRLADALVAAYPREATLMSTHLAAEVAWRFLTDKAGSTDPFRVVRTSAENRSIERLEFLDRLERARQAAVAGAQAGRFHHDLPRTAEDVLATALDRFDRYHKTRALAPTGTGVVVEDPRLCLYYRNRATFAQLEF